MAETLVFGGAFDPPHKEHVAICRHAMDSLGIKKLVLVPTYLPPHKDRSFLSFEDRCKLAEIAFEGIDFTVDSIERERGRDNYSSEILPILKEKYGKIVYLIGGDSLARLDTWHRPQDVVRACPIAVAAREGYGEAVSRAEDIKKKYGGEIAVIDYKGSDVSSSLLKAELLIGETPEEVPTKVIDAIKSRRLFEEYKQTVEQLRSYQTDELFAHSVAVVKRAIDFNTKHRLKQDFNRVFLASILHDNAKQRPSLDGLDVPDDAIGTPVLHQFLGAEKAKRDFGIEDAEILDAIRYHTTARADMSPLEKLIYTADSLSDDRTYEPIPKLRAVALEDFEAGFIETLKYTYDKLVKKGGNVYPLTLEAYKYYIGNDLR